MGRFVDVGKGDKPRPSQVARETQLENFERIFGSKKVQGGSFKQDPATGKFIPSYEWRQKYGRKKYGQAPYVISDIEPYQSPIDDSYVGSRRAQREDLKRNGCRIYEGREQEAKEAEAYKDHKWKQLDKKIQDDLPKVANDLKYQNIQKETRIKSQWLLGED